MYALDLNKFISWLLPTAMRKTTHAAWLNAFLAPLKWLHTQFITWSVSIRTDATITGQVRVLQYYLNRRFFAIGGTITITDSIAQQQLFVFLESENQPLYIPIFISGTQSDFIVNIPLALLPQIDAISAFVTKYKLPGKRFEIVAF